MAKQTYLAPSAIALALTAAGPKGVRLALFSAKDGDKAKFSGSVDITTVDGITTEVVGVKCYATKADGTPLLDKNGKPYLQMMYGNNKDEGYLFGNMFSNTKREGKKDADFTISINLSADNRVDGKVWVSVPKAGGDKYLSGNLGSKAENAPAEASEQPAPAKTSATEPDPFNL
jgi:hypothetical protein